jgi:hypothetical protein
MERAYRQNESHAPETELTPADSNATPMHATESIESETDSQVIAEDGLSYQQA